MSIEPHEHETRRHLTEKASEALTRAHLGWCLPEVAMPVDINDEEQFPEIARACREAREKGLIR